MIDPAMLWVRRNGAACAADIGFHDLAIVAARDDDRLAHGAIRFSLSRYTTDQEVDRNPRARSAKLRAAERMA